MELNQWCGSTSSGVHRALHGSCSAFAI
uniref:Uncharacterized protein n=1 Tax=Arundo donax TaxID=35708 RepID=A0A0A9HJC9_ARUDO